MDKSQESLSVDSTLIKNMNIIEDVSFCSSEKTNISVEEFLENLSQEDIIKKNNDVYIKLDKLLIETMDQIEKSRKKLKSMLIS